MEFNLGQKVAIELARSYFKLPYEDFLKVYEDTKKKCLNENPKYFKDFFIGDIKEGMFFTIQGAAGTGKTTLVNEILKDEESISIKKNDSKSYLGITMSHAAKQVLQEKLDKDLCDVTTVASWLQLSPYVMNGEVYFKPTKVKIPFNDPYAKVDKLIHDEASMSGPTIINRIKEISLHREKEYGFKDFKYLCLLDPYQLPPIEVKEENQGLSPFCNMLGVKLTEIMRYNGAIAEYAETLKRMIDENEMKPYLLIPEVREGDNISIHKNKEDLVNNVLFHINESPRNVNKVKVGAYRNKVVDNISKIVRKQRFKENTSLWNNGDWLVIDEPCEAYRIFKEPESNKIHYSKLQIHTGQFFIVEEVVQEDFKYLGVPCTKLWVSEPDRPNDLIELKVVKNKKEVKTLLKDVWQTVSQSNYSSFRTNILQLKSKYGNWAESIGKDKKEYFKIKEKFTIARYGDAMTLHKLQGSTIDHQWVVISDVLSLKNVSDSDKLRALYVGCTRAKEHLYLTE